MKTIPNTSRMPDPRMRKALVTGATGFTGQHLCAALRQRGYQVAGTTQHKSEVDTESAYLDELHSCDLRDKKKLEIVVHNVRPTHVVHLAGITFVPHADAAEIYHTNVIGTYNLLHALANLDCPPVSIILVSSANIYGNTDVDPIDENTSPCPTNDYAVSKLAMEAMSQLWLDRLPVTIVRPFNYSGVGQSENFLLPKIVGHFARGARTITLGNIDVERDFSDIRTITEVYSRLLEKAPAGQIFNVCSGRSTSLHSILKIMENIAGYHMEVRSDAAFQRAHEIQRLRGNNAKLRAVIGNLPSYPIEKTLQTMFDAMKAEMGHKHSS